MDMLTIEELRRIVVLNYLTDEMLARLLPIVDVLRFGEEEVIFRQGDPSDRFYMVRRGKVLLEQRVAEGISVFVGSIKPGFSFGWSSMIDEGNYSTEAISTEDSVIYSFRFEKAKRLFEADPLMGYRLCWRLLHIIKKRYDQRTDQFIKLMTHHPDMKDLFESPAPESDA